MKKTILLKSMLLLCALIVGSSVLWADDVTYAQWSFTSESYPSNKTNFNPTSGPCTGSTFYLDGSGSTWNATKGYAFNSVDYIYLTLKLATDLPAGSKITFSADTYYNKASNAPMTGFTLTVSENSGEYATTGLSVTSFSLSTSSATKTCVYTTQSALETGNTIVLKYTQTGKAGSGQGYFNNILIEGPELSVTAPTFSPSAGALEKGTSVTLSSTGGATIYYTTDGSTPTTESSTYSTPIIINSATTIKAFAKKGDDVSDVSSASYTIKQVATPTFSVADGSTVLSGTTVELETATDGATIYYTTDGSTPTSSSTTYSSAITIDADMTIKAIAVKTNWDDSEVASASYTLAAPISGLSIDFEAASLSQYTDWAFVNVGLHSGIAGVSAHTGSQWGANINGEGNGVSSCSITTKNKIANPSSIKFYISKESGNTTASSWYVEVSENGSSWTQVGDAQDAKGMDKGEWVEVTRTLTSYSDVYVRIRYNGGSSTAIRAIDDIVLTESVTLNAKGYATYSSAHDFTFSGAQAYKMALNEAAKTITGTEVTGKIKAGEGILFKGSGSGTVTITSTTGATDLDSNNLKGSTQANGTIADKPTYCYVLSGDTFVSYTGATLAANKAYFEASKDLKAHAFTIIFDDEETTGIANVEAKRFVENNKFYNLNGQQVAQPTKGLYIVNGKKVVIK